MSMPRVEYRNGQMVLIVNEEPMFLISGELHNSSSSTAAYMAELWPRLKSMNLNSVLMPMTWQLVEPVEGQFEFDLLDELIEQARSYDMKIGILWFGAWKNACCQYVPDWVKLDPERFKRTEIEKGVTLKVMNTIWDPHMTYTTLSALCEATKVADAKAFAAMMAHIKAVDADQNTIVTIQVENETGLLNAAREQSDLADQLFEAPVPDALIEGLKQYQDSLVEDIKVAFENRKEGGNWRQVFGTAAEEAFQAWNTASYVNYVAAAGKKEYPLPMSANAWLAQGGKPGQYPSGGPVYRVMEIWKVAAPAIDVIAPDIYVPNFTEVCGKYTKINNPLSIPEVAADARVACRELYAIGHHHAMCFSPFGIEDLGAPVDTSLGAGVGMDTSDPALLFSANTKQYAKLNQQLTELMPKLMKAYGTNNLHGSNYENPQVMDFGDVYFTVEFKENGGCLVLREDDTFYVLGMNGRIWPNAKNSAYIELLTLEEGEFSEGQWVRRRILNGDEEHLNLYENTLLKTGLHCFG